MIHIVLQESFESFETQIKKKKTQNIFIFIITYCRDEKTDGQINRQTRRRVDRQTKIIRV